MSTKTAAPKSRCCCSCCSETPVIHPIVAVYGFLWYLNSIYGVVLMIVESSNACFYEWCPVCIVNTTIPIIWLLVIAMVDSCCIRYWSLKQWNRRHYGAAFLYFAFFTNQLIIFGTLCFYGFTVWKKSVASAACHASDHLFYGFIALITTSTVLILWIGIYQFYAATKYLCTYTAVLDVKRRQLQSSPRLKSLRDADRQQHTHSMFNFKRKGKQKNSRQSSIESQSMHTMSFSFIQTIYRYGDRNDNEWQDERLRTDHNGRDTKGTHTLRNGHKHEHEHHHRLRHPDFDAYPFPPLPLTPCASNGDQAMNELMEECQVTPLTSAHPLALEEDESVHNNGMRMEEEEKEKESEIERTENESEHNKEMSASPSESASPSKSTTHIEIAGIVIPTRRFTKHAHQQKDRKKKKTKKRRNKQHDHKRYKAVNKAEQKQSDDGDDDDDNDDGDHDEHAASNIAFGRNHDAEERKSRFLRIAVFGKGVEIITMYFDRLKEDPSTADLCIICYDSFKSDDYLARLKCKHVYHKNCIRIWLANNHSCPLCNFNEKNLNLKLNIHKNS